MATERFTLKMARLAFGNGLFEKTDYKGDGKFKYKIKLIIGDKHPQKAALEALLQKLGKEQWKEKGPAVIKGIASNPNKYCYLDGDMYPDTQGFPGNWIIAASNKTRPTAMDSDGVTQVSAEDGTIYSGCYGNALLEFRTMDSKDGKGLYCTIRGFQFAKDGDAFSGGPPPADVSEFEGLSTASEDDNSDL